MNISLQPALLRSWLFVPGDRQRMIDKALGLSADAMMMDMEDAVAPAEKETARRQVAAALDRIAVRRKESPSQSRIPAQYVRINAIGHENMHADLAGVIRPALQGLVLPKIDTVDQVQLVEPILDRQEAAAGIEAGSVRLLVGIETPRGLLNAPSLAACSPRVQGLIFGAEDFSRELNLPLRREGEARDLIYARSAIVMAAAAARVHAVDAVWTDLQDQEGLRRFALQSRRLGFAGMSVIHPSQIDDVNAAFTPTSEELHYCRRVVQAYHEAENRGEGVVALDGQMLDPPVVERARQTVLLAESLGL